MKIYAHNPLYHIPLLKSQKELFTARKSLRVLKFLRIFLDSVVLRFHSDRVLFRFLFDRIVFRVLSDRIFLRVRNNRLLGSSVLFLPVSGKLPPRKLRPRKLPPRKLPPMKLPPMNICPYDSSPLGKLPPRIFPPRKLPPVKIPLPPGKIILNEIPSPLVNHTNERKNKITK